MPPHASVFFGFLEESPVILAVMQDRQHMDEFIVRAVIDQMPPRQDGAIAGSQIGAVNADRWRLANRNEPRFDFRHIGLRGLLAPFFEGIEIDLFDVGLSRFTQPQLFSLCHAF